MKASTQYTDLIGTSAADVADITTQTNTLEQLADFLKIDQKRFTVVGISIYGTEDYYVSFICVDKERSNKEKEHIVKLHIDNNINVLRLLFKRLQIVLYNKYDTHYPKLDYDEEASLSDYK